MRSLDKLAREQLLEGLGRDDCPIHSAWRSNTDSSGLVHRLLVNAQTVLNRSGVAYLDAEDLLHNALLGLGKKGKPCLKMFVEAGRAVPLKVFSRDPLELGHPSTLLSRWFSRKAQTETRQQDDRLSIEIPVESPKIPLHAFVALHLQHRTELGRTLEKFLISCNHRSAPKDFPERTLCRGGRPYQKQEELAQEYGVHTVTVSRWSRLLWHKAERALSAPLKDLLDTAYENYLVFG
jgi:hypothetical protein